MCLQDEETYCHSRVGLCKQFVRAGEELVEGDEITQRLTHLGAVYGNHIIVHPIFNHRLTHSCHTLRYLTLVMGEHKVHTATVDIELLAQVFAAHSGALAVPTGETVAPGRGPTHNMFGLRTFPQSKIGGIAFLALAVELACGIEYLIEVTARQYTIVVRLVILCHIEIYRALALVCKAIVHNLLHKLYLLYYVARRVRLYAWRQHIERLHHLVIVKRILLHHLHRLKLFKACLLRYLVLAIIGIVFQVAHIGDVAHIAHLVTNVLQITEEHVECNGRACVAQVSRAIYCGAAHIKAHIGGVQRLEKFLFTRQRIIYHQVIFHIILLFIVYNLLFNLRR